MAKLIHKMRWRSVKTTTTDKTQECRRSQRCNFQYGQFARSLHSWPAMSWHRMTAMLEEKIPHRNAGRISETTKNVAIVSSVWWSGRDISWIRGEWCAQRGCNKLRWIGYNAYYGFMIMSDVCETVHSALSVCCGCETARTKCRTRNATPISHAR